MSTSKDRLHKLETKSDSALTRLVDSKLTFPVVAGALVVALVLCWVL